MHLALPNSKKKLHALIEQLRAEIQRRDQEITAHQSELAGKQQLIAERDAQLKEHAALIEKLKIELARLKRWRFGRTAERLSSTQLALWESELDGDIAALERRLQALEGEQLPASHTAPDSDERQAKRRRLPAHLPRVDVLHDLASKHCPACEAPLERIGEEVSEQLDIIPAKFFVRRHVRPKYCCRHCERLHLAALPTQPIDKGLAAAGLISYVAVNKYLNHLPLYRQEAEFERLGVAIARSSMAGWLGNIEVLVEPLVNRMIEHLTAQSILHADETPVPVLNPGAGKTATGYLWAYRSSPYSALQAVAFDFAMSRAAEHPSRLLAPFSGTLVVDGYAGYNAVLRRPGMIEAACMAHARRAFHDIVQANGSPIAKHALIEIAKLYAIEAELKPLSPEQRALERRSRAGPILAEFKRWLDETYAKSPPKSAIAKALAYSINRWRALTRYQEDGMLNIDNNPVENAIRGIALGRKNWLFAGSESGGRRAALFYSLIESAKLNGVNPHVYLTHVLTALPTAKARDLDALLPWNFKPQPEAQPVF